MRQELRPDRAAQSQVKRHGKQNTGNAHRDVSMLNGCANRDAIMPDKPMQDRILPFPGALVEGHAGQNRRDDDRESQRPQQRERNRPGHRLEEPSLHRLQGKDRQIRADDDADCVEDRPLHFMCCLANLLPRGARVVFVREMADDVLNHHHRSVDHHAEIQRSE